MRTGMHSTRSCSERARAAALLAGCQQWQPCRAGSHTPRLRAQRRGSCRWGHCSPELRSALRKRTAIDKQEQQPTTAEGLRKEVFRGLLRGVLLARPKVTTFGAGFNLRPLPCPLRPPPRPPLRLAPRPAVVRPLLCAPLLCASLLCAAHRVTRAHTIGPCSSRHTSTPSAAACASSCGGRLPICVSPQRAVGVNGQ